MPQDDLENNIKKSLEFLRKDPNHTFMSEEIAQEIGISIESAKQAIDDLILNQFVDVPTKGDYGTPCVKINYSGNNKLNRLTDKSEPLPSKNSGDTYIAGGDMFIDKSHKEVNSKKTINFFNITSKKREISIIVLIGIIIAGIGVAWDITSDINIESPIRILSNINE